MLKQQQMEEKRAKASTTGRGKPSQGSGGAVSSGRSSSSLSQSRGHSVPKRPSDGGANIDLPDPKRHKLPGPDKEKSKHVAAAPPRSARDSSSNPQKVRVNINPELRSQMSGLITGLSNQVRDFAQEVSITSDLSKEDIVVTPYYRANYKPNELVRPLNSKDKSVMFNRNYGAFVARCTTQPLDRDYFSTLNPYDFADKAVSEAAKV